MLKNGYMWSRYSTETATRGGWMELLNHVGFVVDKVELGQVFSEYFGFPCQSSFHQLLHNHPHLSSGACTIGQMWPQYLVDLVPPHKKNSWVDGWDEVYKFIIVLGLN
jgi:hypothetical protein